MIELHFTSNVPHSSCGIILEKNYETVSRSFCSTVDQSIVFKAQRSKELLSRDMMNSFHKLKQDQLGQRHDPAVAQQS